MASPWSWVDQPLIQAQAKEYVRQTQERLIGAPILRRLNAQDAEAGTGPRLLALLDGWRGRPAAEQGYGPGNVVNLLRRLRGDLEGVDLSGLAIRQAYLQDGAAPGASLAGAHLAETVLGEAFGYPTALALSTDGAYLAAGTASGEVCRWRVADRTLLATLPGHDGAIWGVALSGDGRLVASGGDDGTVRLWTPSTGACLRLLRDDRRYERVDITGLTGVTEAQRQVLLALGAVERSGDTSLAN